MFGKCERNMTTTLPISAVKRVEQNSLCDMPFIQKIWKFTYYLKKEVNKYINGIMNHFEFMDSDFIRNASVRSNCCHFILKEYLLVL